MVLKQFILTKRSCADSAFVGEVGGLQGLAVVLGYVVQQLPLVDLKMLRDENTVMMTMVEIALPCHTRDTDHCPGPC